MTSTPAPAYHAREGSEPSVAYDARHGIESRPVLTVHTPEGAETIANYIAPWITGRTVVEVGGGIGLLGMHMASIAERVFVIEANPAWSHAFVEQLYANKPRNLSYLFGAAEEFAGQIGGDVALFCAYSGAESLRNACALFAPVVLDVFGDLRRVDPRRTDRTAVEAARAKFLRPVAPPGNVWKASATGKEQ